MSSSTRQQRLNRKNAVAEVASRYFHHGTRQIWDALVLIALGKFTEPTRRPEVRYMSDGQILPTEEGNRRRMWDFLATRFNDASPKEPFDAKAAERILREWSNLVRGCSEVHQYRTRDLFRPTWEEWREVADQMDRAKKNPAPVAGAVIAAVAQALLPAVMKAGSNQIEAYKRADMNGKVKLLKKWSVYTLNFQLRLLLQHKPTARRVARDLDKLLKNKKALKQIETAGRVGLEAGKAYKGAKGKTQMRKITAKKNTREVNPYSKRYTLDSFTKKYFPGERVSPGVAKSFWDDFRFGYQGGLGRYIKETTWVDGEQLAKKNPTKAASRRAKSRRGKEKFVKLDVGHPDWSRGWTEEFEVKATSVAEAKKKARAQGYIVRYAEDHGMMMRHIDKLEKERQLAYAQAGLDLTDANVRKEAREQGWEQFPTKEKFGRLLMYRWYHRLLAKKNPKKGGEWYSNFSEEELRYEIEDLEEKLADSYRAASRRGPNRLDWSHELDDWPETSWSSDLADLRRELKRQEAMAKKNGPTLGKPHYPFAEKEKQYAKYTTEALYHAMNDAMAASRAQQGWNEAGANWYLDDYHTLVKEIQRRKGRR